MKRRKTMTKLSERYAVLGTCYSTHFFDIFRTPIESFDCRPPLSVVLQRQRVEAVARDERLDPVGAGGRGGHVWWSIICIAR